MEQERRRLGREQLTAESVVLRRVFFYCVCNFKEKLLSCFFNAGILQFLPTCFSFMWEIARMLPMLLLSSNSFWNLEENKHGELFQVSC